MRKPCRDGQIRNPETGRCNFIKKNIIPDVKPNPEPEEPKIEEPKTEEPKIEEPKIEEPKIEEPKTEKPEKEEPETSENLKLNKIQDQIDQITKVKPREIKININNNNGLGDSSLNNLFVLSKKDMINNHLMEDQEVPEIIRGIKFSTN